MDNVLRNFHNKIKSLVTKSFLLFTPKVPLFGDPQAIADFIATYNPKKKLFLLWDIPEKFQAFYTLFFEDQQVFFLKSSEEYLHLRKSPSIASADITLIAMHNRNTIQATSFCKKYKIHFVSLNPGLIGHPIYHNLSACFLDFVDEILIKRIQSIELTPALLEQAARLQHLYCLLQIGKGSSPSFINVDKFLGPKLKKRVLVLTHPEPPLTENSPLMLALQENPEAEIYLYRKDAQPSFELLHEEIVINEQTHHFKVISKTVRTTELIIACDHVYTNHAVDAVDAIFYHKKLTVTDKPFYAGWGLTDDRRATPHPRQLSSNEFFAIIFLKCTRYCYDNHDPVTGLLSTLLDVAGSYVVQKAHTALEPFSTEKLSCVRASDYWPAIFNIPKAKPLLPTPDETIVIYSLGKKANAALTAAFIGAELNGTARTSAELVARKLQEANSLITSYQFAEAEKKLYLLLQNGFICRDIFSMLAHICAATFHLQDAINLQEIAVKMTNPKLQKYSLKHNEVLYILGDGEQLLKSICLAIKSVPSQFIQAYTFRTLLQEQFGADFNYENCFFNASKGRLKNGKRTENNLVRIANGYSLLQEPKKQLEILAYIKNPKNILKFNLSKVSAYIQNGEYAKAREILNAAIIHFPQITVYRDAVRLALLMGDYIWAEQLFNKAKIHNLYQDDELIELSLMRRFLCNTQQLQEGFKKFRKVEICKILQSCLGKKYIQQSSEATGNEILIVSISGIGDEIRVATMYRKMAALFPNQQVSFTCEPRLLELFTNSYPELEFIPAARLRSLNYKTGLNNYNELPHLQLHQLFDNKAWNQANHVDAVTLTTDLLGELLKDKTSFCSASYLKASSTKIAHWAQRSKSNRIKIGISWRSSLLSHNRTTSYLTVEQLKPLFDKFAEKNVELFNFQYDDATEELAWINSKTKGKITHFADLDQFNDINSVAAAMSCMDLIIAPPTAVIELAGALGRPSFLLSNTGEMAWRKYDEISKTDVWSRSIVHIEGSTCGDKVSLVENLIQALDIYIAEKIVKTEEPIVLN